MRATLVAIAVALAVVVLATGASGDPNQDGEHYVSVEWQEHPNDPPAGRKIVVRYFPKGFTCQYRFHSATARETSKSVTIKVLEHWHEADQEHTCIAVLGGGEATVKLKRPLGDRALRHAPVDDPGTGR